MHLARATSEIAAAGPVPLDLAGMPPLLELAALLAAIAQASHSGVAFLALSLKLATGLGSLQCEGVEETSPTWERFLRCF